MKIRNQHYVWRFYLNAWAHNDQIFCLREDNIFRTNLINIGSMRDFYKLKELNESDISLITRLFLKDSNPVLKTLNENWLKIFTSVFDFKQRLQKDTNKNDFIEKQLDELTVNLEENLHGKIEEKTIPYIEELRREHIPSIKPQDDLLGFIYYLSVQYFRTKKIKMSVIKSTSKYPQYDFQKIWNVCSHILATNFAYNLQMRINEFNIILLKNKTIIPFITGDQPVINTYADYENNVGLDELELYYPIKPSLALLITKKHKILNDPIINMNESEIQQYNSLMHKSSHEQIYANEENILLRYKSTSPNRA